MWLIVFAVSLSSSWVRISSLLSDDCEIELEQLGGSKAEGTEIVHKHNKNTEQRKANFMCKQCQ